MIDIDYLNSLSYRKKLNYLKAHNKYLICYTNEIPNFLIMYSNEISTSHYKYLITKLDTYLEEIIDIIELYWNMKRVAP